jgi:hypothetical protein
VPGSPSSRTEARSGSANLPWSRCAQLVPRELVRHLRPGRPCGTDAGEPTRLPGPSWQPPGSVPRPRVTLDYQEIPHRRRDSGQRAAPRLSPRPPLPDRPGVRGRPTGGARTRPFEEDVRGRDPGGRPVEPHRCRRWSSSTCSAGCWPGRTPWSAQAALTAAGRGADRPGRTAAAPWSCQLQNDGAAGQPDPRGGPPSSRAPAAVWSATLTSSRTGADRQAHDCATDLRIGSAAGKSPVGPPGSRASRRGQLARASRGAVPARQEVDGHAAGSARRALSSASPLPAQETCKCRPHPRWCPGRVDKHVRDVSPSATVALVRPP